MVSSDYKIAELHKFVTMLQFHLLQRKCAKFLLNRADLSHQYDKN